MPLDPKQLQFFQQGFGGGSGGPQESDEERLLREQEAQSLQNAKIEALRQMLGRQEQPDPQEEAARLEKLQFQSRVPFYGSGR